MIRTGLWLMLWLAQPVWGQSSTAEDDWDDDWGDDWGEASPVSHSGFLEWAQAHRISTDDIFSDQRVLSEGRWHHAFDYEHEDFDFNWSHDVYLDDVLGGLQLDLRELNFQFSLFGQTDVVLGRQITTWGTGDLLFINDQFPKDWQSFFAGRDDNYLKAPADAIRITSYFEALNIDWVLTPTAEPDRFINGERFSLFFPLAGSQVGGREVINPVNPRQPEYAVRLFKNIQGHQLALYGYHGIEKSPNGINAAGEPFFPRKNVWGASWQSTVGAGLVNLELGRHVALDDSTGNQPLIANGQWRLLLGYERELVKNLNWGMQYYLEKTTDYQQLMDHSLAPEFEPAENRHVMTSRFTYRAMQEKLTWSLFVFYSPTDDDSYWRPSVNYRHNDQWQMTLGGSVFTGQQANTFFGQFEDASQAYVRLRFQY
ncbi:hypothetical protein [Marinicella sediminis]|nr:hypothetical protein [Marinicella sediminis]